MNVAIIGCGLIGTKRALALDKDDKLVGCCDTDKKTLEQFSSQFGCKAYADHQALLTRSSCDAVVISVVNKFSKDLVVDALKAGLHVLAEKPLGRGAQEAREMVKLSSAGSQLRLSQKSLEANATSKPILKPGFNHRFNPAIMQAKKRVESGDIGTVLSIRGRYGHGGRPGMENEWRASKELCGGGEMLDQGVHLVDLIRWFGGEVVTVMAKVEIKFWAMEVEDNAFAILTTSDNVTASIAVSWFNWKNIFSFEIFGSEGYLRIEGLGGSYGPETLEFGRRNKQGGEPEVTAETFPPEDTSWKKEWKEFKDSIAGHREPVGNGVDGLRANRVIEAVYESSRTRREVAVSAD